MRTVQGSSSRPTKKAHAAASRFDPDVQVRIGLDAAGSAVFELADGPRASDSTIDVQGLTVFFASGMDGVVDAGEHDTLIYLPRATT